MPRMVKNISLLFLLLVASTAGAWVMNIIHMQGSFNNGVYGSPRGYFQVNAPWKAFTIDDGIEQDGDFDFVSFYRSDTNNDLGFSIEYYPNEYMSFEDIVNTEHEHLQCTMISMKQKNDAVRCNGSWRQEGSNLKVLVILMHTQHGTINFNTAQQRHDNKGLPTAEFNKFIQTFKARR